MLKTKNNDFSGYLYDMLGDAGNLTIPLLYIFTSFA